MSSLPDKLAQALNDQANHELFAAHSYESMRYWCLEHDFNGFAEFFASQAAEEREHAEKFFGHLLDRGYTPRLEAIGKPQSDFGGLPSLAALSGELERLNTEKIAACYRLALELGDFRSHPLLLEFMEEQVEEEAWTDSMVALTRRAECPGAAYNLDRHINKELRSGES